MAAPDCTHPTLVVMPPVGVWCGACGTPILWTWEDPPKPPVMPKPPEPVPVGPPRQPLPKLP